MINLFEKRNYPPGTTRLIITDVVVKKSEIRYPVYGKAKKKKKKSKNTLYGYFGKTVPETIFGESNRSKGVLVKVYFNYVIRFR